MTMRWTAAQSRTCRPVHTRLPCRSTTAAGCWASCSEVPSSSASAMTMCCKLLVAHCKSAVDQMAANTLRLNSANMCQECHGGQMQCPHSHTHTVATLACMLDTACSCTNAGLCAFLPLHPCEAARDVNSWQDALAILIQLFCELD